MKLSEIEPAIIIDNVSMEVKKHNNSVLDDQKHQIHKCYTTEQVLEYAKSQVEKALSILHDMATGGDGSEIPKDIKDGIINKIFKEA